MKIIKQGNPYKPERRMTIHFICKHCGCVYEATESECTSYYHGSDTYLSNCPCCNELCLENKMRKCDIKETTIDELHE